MHLLSFSEASHAACIEMSYNELNAKIIECDRKVFRSKMHKGKNNHDWNLYVESLYDEYRSIFP